MRSGLVVALFALSVFVSGFSSCEVRVVPVPPLDPGSPGNHQHRLYDARILNSYQSHDRDYAIFTVRERHTGATHEFRVPVADIRVENSTTYNRQVVLDTSFHHSGYASWVVIRADDWTDYHYWRWRVGQWQRNACHK